MAQMYSFKMKYSDLWYFHPNIKLDHRLEYRIRKYRL